MIRTKNILQEICNTQGRGIQLSKDDLKRLQTHLIKMYKDLEEVCDRHRLNICIAYGNVIGAMRHGGWIPWDDDLDVHMSRKDYELLLTKYADELPPQYKVFSVYNENGPIARFAKIVDTTTTFVSLGDEKSVHSGVFLDIFPVDNFEPNSKLNGLRKLWIYFMMYTVTSVTQWRSKSKEYKELMCSTNSGRLNYYFRHIWGFCFSFIPDLTWYRWINKFSIQRKETGYVHVPVDLDLCFKGAKEDIFFPPKKYTLDDGIEVYIPNSAIDYLNLVYSNWREIPKDKDKWHHYVKEFNIPD